MSSVVDEFIRRGLRYGDPSEKMIVISPTALRAITEKYPTNIDETADELADGYFLGAFGFRVPYLIRKSMARNTAVMLDRKVVSRLDS